MKKAPQSIAILASGTGTNADAICSHFAGHSLGKVVLIVTNNPEAGVLNVARRHGVQTAVVPNADIAAQLVSTLQEHGVEWVILAGFLRKIPENVLEAFPNRIINIHPALLPDFGGKGMYGSHVHEAVIQAGKTESGITIHRVNAHYDKGEILFQARCPVMAGDTPQSLAARIHTLEHQHYPQVIEEQLHTYLSPHATL